MCSTAEASWDSGRLKMVDQMGFTCKQPHNSPNTHSWKMIHKGLNIYDITYLVKKYASCQGMTLLSLTNVVIFTLAFMW